MSLSRNPPIKPHRVTLRGLTGDKLNQAIESCLNDVLDHLRLRTVVLPVETQSLTPADGELLFDGSSLFLVQGGAYRQVWPSAAGSTLEVGEESLNEWPTRSSCTYTQLIITSGSTSPTLLALNTMGQTMRLAYLEVNNAANSNRIVSMQWGSSTSATRYFVKLVSANGGEVVQNFVGVEFADGTPGSDLYCNFSTSGSGSTYVCAGYYYRL